MRCTIRFDAANPDQGDGYCLYCLEELRYAPAELAHMRAAGEASSLLLPEARPAREFKTSFSRREGINARRRERQRRAAVALPSGGA